MTETKVSGIKKILSYFFPVRIKKSSGAGQHALELFLYKGGYQLATEDALYSDGARYRPLVLAYRCVEQQLPEIKKVLVLGAGAGSAVHIFHEKNLYPEFTLVEIDDIVYAWASEIFKNHGDVKLILADAEVYIKEDRSYYDLLIIDVFFSRIPAGFVAEKEFLLSCKERLAKGGILVVNYIINSPGSLQRLEQNIKTLFPDTYRVLAYDINRIIIATT